VEREVSITIEIAVALIAVSALLAIVFFTVFMGNDMSNSVSLEASNLITVAEAGSIDELVGNNNIMPASGAYSLIRSRSGLIADYNCNIGHTVSKSNLSMGDSPCILKHLTGKISLQVDFLDTGWYKLTVHYMNCTWSTSGCNCASIRAAG
jgi:hypothetical protein